jgi:hypothetical protein
MCDDAEGDRAFEPDNFRGVCPISNRAKFFSCTAAKANLNRFASFAAQR